jgi:ribose-phosphate pyrophosphokinase
MADHSDLLIFAGSATPKLAGAIAAALGTALSPCEAIRFGEGNTFVRVLDNVRGREVFVIQGVSHLVNDNFVELLFWIDALKRASARRSLRSSRSSATPRATRRTSRGSRSARASAPTR